MEIALGIILGVLINVAFGVRAVLRRLDEIEEAVRNIHFSDLKWHSVKLDGDYIGKDSV
jgi:MFS superfamily sulfate permease-like transporter